MIRIHLKSIFFFYTVPFDQFKAALLNKNIIFLINFFFESGEYVLSMRLFTKKIDYQLQKQIYCCLIHRKLHELKN